MAALAGALLLRHVSDDSRETFLFCGQHRRTPFYERHDLVADAFGDGSANEEGLPDILYVRRRIPADER